jgi:ABC-type Mn2+/Zn2+ transport system ATPase subunit
VNAHAIEIENLHVRVGQRTVLAIDALNTRDGTMTAVLGPNGSGKTTLLRAILGLQASCSGQIRVFGLQVRGASSSALRRLRRQTGYVPQLLSTRSETPLTVREVVVMGRTARAGLLRRLGQNDWRQVDVWLERLGLADLGGRPYSDLSGGEQRKTLIARAMVNEPRMLLLDETTANLDLASRERLVDLIASLQADLGLAVMLVCHELEALPAHCPWVAFLEAGKLFAQGPPREMFTDDRVRRLYGERLEAVSAGGRYAVLPRTPNTLWSKVSGLKSGS